MPIGFLLSTAAFVDKTRPGTRNLTDFA